MCDFLDLRIALWNIEQVIFEILFASALKLVLAPVVQIKAA